MKTWCVFNASQASVRAKGSFKWVDVQKGELGYERKAKETKRRTCKTDRACRRQTQKTDRRKLPVRNFGIVADCIFLYDLWGDPGNPAALQHAGTDQHGQNPAVYCSHGDLYRDCMLYRTMVKANERRDEWTIAKKEENVYVS